MHNGLKKVTNFENLAINLNQNIWAFIRPLFLLSESRRFMQNWDHISCKKLRWTWYSRLSDNLKTENTELSKQKFLQNG